MTPRMLESSVIAVALLAGALVLAGCAAPTPIPTGTPPPTLTLAVQVATPEPPGSPTPVPTPVPLAATPLPPLPTATVMPPSPTATIIPASSTPIPPTATRQPGQAAAAASATATSAPAGRAATATRPAAAGRTPSPLPLASTPGVTPTAACLRLPVRGFGKVWSDEAHARELVGCASYTDEKGMQFEAQRFERGVMIWTNADLWDNKKVVWVLFADDRSYGRVPDNWGPGEAEPAATPAPEGKLAPSGRLGKAWREGAGVRDRLGWAVEPPTTGNGAYQEFDRGLMFWVPFRTAAGEDRRIHVLSRYLTCPPCGPRTEWAAYRDTWQ